MIAPPSSGEDTKPFLRVARHLQNMGLSAPKIYEADSEAGFILLEDFGDDLFARYVDQHPNMEERLYTAAAEVLGRINAEGPPVDGPFYGEEEMRDAALLAVDWYAQAGTSRDDMASAVEDMLSGLRGTADGYALRDYHAENLVWLPERDGAARVGLLDFQDAMVCDPAYDLVSLLQDARRDVPEAIVASTKQKFLELAGMTEADLDRSYFRLGVQRNLRILGVFARLCVRDGKPGYISLIPRVWDHLQRSLDSGGLIEIAGVIERTLPEPTPSFLERLKVRCGQAQQ